MQIKFFEIRDRGTCIAVMCVNLKQTVANLHIENVMLSHAGFGTEDCILLTILETGESSHDPYGWKDKARTIPTAHVHIDQSWNMLRNGQIIDVQSLCSEPHPTIKSSRFYRCYLVGCSEPHPTLKSEIV